MNRSLATCWFLVCVALVACSAVAQEFDAKVVQGLVEQSAAKGNPARGAVIYASPTSACISCHKVGQHGGSVGPDLSKIAINQKLTHIVESLLYPKKVVAKEYQAVGVLTDDGAITRGYLVAETAETIQLRDSATNTVKRIAQENVEAVQQIGSLMPGGLMANLSPQDKWDLIAFLSDLGKHKLLQPEAIDSLLAHSHGHHAATFEVTPEPLDPKRYPSWQANVNRNRTYQFYGKQARHFRSKKPTPHLLAEYPGLDGGTLGHWGNQSDADWADGRWNESDLGSLLSGVFHGDKANVGRGICVQLRDGDSKMSVCFDPDTLSYRRAWTGGFVKFTDVRRGFMQGLNQDGSTVAIKNHKHPKGTQQYQGLYRNGDRVIFAYKIGDTEFLDAPKLIDGKLQHVIAPRDQHPDRELCTGGKPQWPQEFVVKGILGDTQPYACDKIPMPIQNPWKTLLYGSGIAFLSDGSAIYTTMQGDVWKVTGLDKTLANVSWRRIASGLHQPLGVVTEADKIFIIGRDQITRLHDLNSDGEMDFYECFSQAIETSRGGHDFTCGLVRDQQGNFFTATGKQGVMRVSADGKYAESIATGLRNSDGIGLYPDGMVTVPSSEGDWMPASMIAAVVPGKTLNRLVCEPPIDRRLPFFGRPGKNLKGPPELPMVYLPRGLDNSSGGQVFVADERWGPAKGNMVHLSFGAGTGFILLRDQFDDWVQGAVVPLGVEFASGAHRGEFNPIDGQLYVAGMGGWGTYTTDDGCLQRVRINQQAAQLPTGFHVHRNGVLVKFSQVLDASVVNDPDSHFAQCWNYRYSGAYGSPEFSSRQMGLRGHDVLAISSATVVGDGRSLFLEIPDLQPVNQLHLLIKTSESTDQDLFMTVNHLDKDFTDYDQYARIEKARLPHPMMTDFYRPKTMKRNPNRKAIKDAREIQISAAKNLMFDKTVIRVKAGEPIRLTFNNPDAVPHNWALVKPGTLKKVGQQCNQLIADPQAATNHYVPQTDDVLVYVDVVEPNGKFTVYFNAPAKPGSYPYLCTFPGHWMIMNGQLIVE